MDGANKEILDLVAGIEIDYDTFPLHNLHALDYLPQGLYELAVTVRNKEIREVRQYLETVGGPIPSSISMPGRYGRLVASLFDWFAISLCNYLRLVALIDIVSRNHWSLDQISRNHKTVKRHCNAYVEDVVPEVRLWRDKVSAHPALTDPRWDNLSMLQSSVADSFTLSAGRFVAGSLRFMVGEEEPPVLPWSVTEVYERLAPRFWNQAALPPLPEG